MAEKILIPGPITTEFEIIGPEQFNVKRSQDISRILDRNKLDQADSAFNNGYTPSRDMQHVGRIPLIVLEQWAKEAGIPGREIFGPKMNEIIRKKLNDPENKFMRTGQGEL